MGRAESRVCSATAVYTKHTRSPTANLDMGSPGKDVATSIPADCLPVLFEGF